MPGSTESSAMVPAAITESPIAVTCWPGTLRSAESEVLAAGPETGRGACRRGAAPTRSPMVICFCMPAGAAGAGKTPHPAVQATVRTAAAARFIVNLVFLLLLTALFSPREGERKRRTGEWEGRCG